MNTREVGYLQAARRHALGAVEGLDDDALRRPVLPSGWSCLTLVNHLAIDIERFWFRAVVAAETDVVAGFAGEPNDAWDVPADVPAAEVLQRYRDESARADEIIAATPADAAPSWWPGELFGDFRLDDLHDVVLHVLLETATHAGHLDAARELLDGRQWLVLN